jgi:hypothetical protein
MRLLGPPAVRAAILACCVAILGIATAWLYWPMRDVMDVGGSCAEGGPYVIQTHCPEGSTTFLTLGLPLFMAAVFVGFVAVTMHAPLPVFPGWALLFGALGWNFFDYGFHADPSGRPVVSWLVCGVVFWLMALPAVVIFVGWPVLRSRFTATRVRLDERSPDVLVPDAVWTPLYLVLLAIGWWLGTLSLHAWT